MAAGSTRWWWPKVLVALSCSALLLALAGPAMAATLQVQGVLRSAGGGPVADGDYVLIVRLYDKKDAGLFVWDDTLTGVKVQNGFFALELGTSIGKPLADALLTSGQPLWLGVQVGSDSELPRAALGTVPRAYFAQLAGGLQCTGCIGPDAIADDAVTASKVAFGYAASDTKGGAATTALTANFAKTAGAAASADEAFYAKTAGSADQAKAAQSAQTAALAQSAQTALTAAKAAALDCSGCIEPGHLGQAVVSAFLSTAGGKVSGTLQVDGTLALGKSVVSGGRFEGIDIKATPCQGGDFGRVALDTASKRLWLCDGFAWQRILVCTDACPAPSTVACGQPLANSCGDATSCPGTGSQCAAGQLCVAGSCAGPGMVKDTAVASCKALQTADPAAKSGPYWIDPDAGGPLAPFRTLCEMTADGGGWTLVLKSAVDNAELHYDAELWNKAGVLNEADLDLGKGKNAKYGSFDTLAVTQLRLTIGSVTKVMTLANAAKGKTLLQLTSSALDQVPDTTDAIAGNCYKPTGFWGQPADGHECYVCSALSFNYDTWSPDGSLARIGYGLSQEFPCGHNGTAEGFGLKNRGSDLQQLGSGRLQWDNEPNYFAAGAVWVR